MSTMSGTQRRIAEVLGPYGLYLQRRTLPDTEIPGYPIEPGLLVIAGVVLATFCGAFVKEFGSECGRQAGQALARWLTRLRSAEEGPAEDLILPQDEDELLRPVLSEIAGVASKDGYAKFRSKVTVLIGEVLTEAGLTRRRSVQVTETIVDTIEVEATHARRKPGHRGH